MEKLLLGFLWGSIAAVWIAVLTHAAAETLIGLDLLLIGVLIPTKHGVGIRVSDNSFRVSGHRLVFRDGDGGELTAGEAVDSGLVDKVPA